MPPLNKMNQEGHSADAHMSNHLHVILRNRPDVVAPLVRSGCRSAVAGPLPGPHGDQAGSRLLLLPGRFSWGNGRTGPIDIAWHSSHAIGPGTGTPAGAGGRDAECGSSAAGDDPRAAPQLFGFQGPPGRADRPPGKPRGPLSGAVFRE